MATRWPRRSVINTKADPEFTFTFAWFIFMLFFWVRFVLRLGCSLFNRRLVDNVKFGYRLLLSSLIVINWFSSRSIVRGRLANRDIVLCHSASALAVRVAADIVLLLQPRLGRLHT